MKLILPMTLILTLFSTAGALVCQTCANTQCSSTKAVTCQSVNYCVAASIEANSSGTTVPQIYKSCDSTYLCAFAGTQQYSYNLGDASLVATVQCCKADSCNSATLPFPAPESTNSLECYTCNQTTSTCTTPLQCRGTQNSCIKTTLSNGNKNVPAYGCGSSNLGPLIPSLRSFPFMKSLGSCTQLYTCMTSFCNGPPTTTSAAPTTTTSAAPTTTTSAAPKTTTSAAPTTITSAAPKTTTSAAPKTTTSAAPMTTTSAAPKTTTSAAPTTITSAASKTTTSAAPTTTTTNTTTTTTNATTTTNTTTTTTNATTTTTTNATTTTTTTAPMTTTTNVTTTTTTTAPMTTTTNVTTTTTTTAPMTSTTNATTTTTAPMTTTIATPTRTTSTTSAMTTTSDASCDKLGMIHLLLGFLVLAVY